MLEKPNFKETLVSPHTPLPNSNSHRDSNRQSINTVYSYRGKKADRIVESCHDLIDDPAYIKWFFKRLYAVGPEQFLACADKARKFGLDKGSYFVDLLKKEPSRA